jgi:glutamine amidotransferase
LNEKVEMATTVAIINYGSGNLRSAAKAFERTARDQGLDSTVISVTGDADLVRLADRVVLPGVGAFGSCYAGLAALPGMLEALDEAVIKRSRPFLGICVGMQLMATNSCEYGNHRGLDWITGRVERINPNDQTLKVPHIGWNNLQFITPNHPILAGLNSTTHAYFVHSYHLVPANPACLLATANYGGPIAAAIGYKNLVGTQFHPEKSQKVGLHLIANFLRWRP